MLQALARATHAFGEMELRLSAIGLHMSQEQTQIQVETHM
jgi:hypothetical protein